MKSGAIATVSIASLSMMGRAQTNKNSKLRILQIGVDGIGNTDRGKLQRHPMVEFAGFCDVNGAAIDKLRKIFRKRGDLRTIGRRSRIAPMSLMR